MNKKTLFAITISCFAVAAALTLLHSPVPPAQPLFPAPAQQRIDAAAAKTAPATAVLPPARAVALENQSDPQLDAELALIQGEIDSTGLIARANSGTLDEAGRAHLSRLLQASNAIQKIKAVRLLAKLDGRST